jgi:hypothetical protein
MEKIKIVLYYMNAKKKERKGRETKKPFWNPEIHKMA